MAKIPADTAVSVCFLGLSVPHYRRFKRGGQRHAASLGSQLGGRAGCGDACFATSRLGFPPERSVDPAVASLPVAPVPVLTPRPPSLNTLEVIAHPQFEKADQAWLTDIRARRAGSRGAPYFTLVFPGADLAPAAFARSVVPFEQVSAPVPSALLLPTASVPLLSAVPPV